MLHYLWAVNHVCEGKYFRTPWSHIPITFTEADLKLTYFPHKDPLVIRANIVKNSVHFLGNDVGRILVDTGSSADLITWQCFVKMGFTVKNLKKSEYPLIGFGGNKIEAVGKADPNHRPRHNNENAGHILRHCGHPVSVQWHLRKKYHQQVRSSNTPAVSVHENSHSW